MRHTLTDPWNWILPLYATAVAAAYLLDAFRTHRPPTRRVRNPTTTTTHARGGHHNDHR